MIYRTRGEHANTTDAVDITKKNGTLSKKIKIKFSKIYYSMNHNNFLPLKLKIYPISGIAIKTFFAQKRHYGRSWVQDYKIGMFCFSTKYKALRRKSKDWLAQNQDNVSEWEGLLFQ
jgi:hypothetical protein